MLVQSVLYCMLEPLAASINPLNDHWVLRDYASRLLAQITRWTEVMHGCPVSIFTSLLKCADQYVLCSHCRDWNSPVNKLRQENLKALREVLLDLGRPFSSHYGAVVGLATLGTKVRAAMRSDLM